MAVDPATARLIVAAATEVKDRLPQILAAIVGLVLVAALIVLMPLMLILAVGQAATSWMSGGSQGGVPSGPDAAMIARYEGIYKSAANQYQVNWYLLASIHKQESSFSHGTAQGIHSGVNAFGCCSGPMQFNVRDGTWDAHKDGYVPIDGERPADYPFEVAPHPSPFDDFDAIAAAGHKLKADGATTDLDSEGTFRAVCRYIGACQHVEHCGGINSYCDVLPRAKRWAQEGIETTMPGVLPQPPTSVGGDSAFPVAAGWRITTLFGEVDALHPRPHTGLDLAQGSGTPVYAIHRGRVSLVQTPGNVRSGYGNYVCVDHADLDVLSCYAHLKTGTVRVSVGDDVAAGQVIAGVGTTGHSTGDHLHFEIKSRTPSPKTGRYGFACPAPYIGLESSRACARSAL